MRVCYVTAIFMPRVALCLCVLYVSYVRAICMLRVPSAYYVFVLCLAVCAMRGLCLCYV